jgi:hypothetical protein
MSKGKWQHGERARRTRRAAVIKTCLAGKKNKKKEGSREQDLLNAGLGPF